MSGSLLPVLPPTTEMSLYLAPPRQQQLSAPQMYSATRYQKAIRYKPESHVDCSTEHNPAVEG